jgi:uncharacterized OsmC-like protein
MYLRQSFCGSRKDRPRSENSRIQSQDRWKGQTKTITSVSDYTLGDKKYSRDFQIHADEPNQLLGRNAAPNPQELLMAALNACLLVGYAANAAAMGIKLEKLEIETEGQLDLRGFLGLASTVKPGYEEVHYTVHVNLRLHRKTQGVAPIGHEDIPELFQLRNIDPDGSQPCSEQLVTDELQASINDLVAAAAV